MWILFDLHGFNISLDLVHDPMHSLALGVFKTFNERLLSSCNNVEVKKLMKVLNHVTENRPIGLGAGWPRQPLYVKNVSGRGSKWKFSNYKAEEHFLFTMYCAAPILEELGHTLATPMGAEGAIIIHLSRLFFSVSRKHGWTREMLEMQGCIFQFGEYLLKRSMDQMDKIIEHVIGK